MRAPVVQLPSDAAGLFFALLSILSPCYISALTSFICALALAHRPRKAAALSSSVHTRRRFLTHAPRCGRACHSPASAYADSNILAGRVSAALRLRVRATLTGPDYQFDWRVCARVGHVCPTLLPSFHYFVFSTPPRLALSLHPLPSFALLHLHPHLPLPSSSRTNERDLRRVLHPALTSSRIPLRAHDPSRPSVPPPLLFRIRRYTRSRYADLRLIHAAAARHAPAPYPALRSADSMPCLPVLSSLSPSLSPCGSPPPPLYLLDLLPHLRPHSFWLSSFPVSLPPPSRASMRRSINAAAPSVELLELPRGARADLRAASLWAPAPARTRPRSARLARDLAPLSSPSLLTHSSDPFPPRPFPRLSFCTRLIVSLSPSLLARSPHARLGAFILILHDTSRLYSPPEIFPERI
ncbi:hypothetical protein DFH08DRAFT_996512 [Mycena albidolilacea]|uniref:Uncharacterized protein n=1 Tax=Mycena albidolilacea TaxID=1033008 RepID=A0AAD6YX24_9AGAR|nr:hypothetical protein DFH08DRAFT_996512 [Mycena albidolilacea]